MMKFTGVYRKIDAAYETHPRFIVNEGGARSSKTVSTLQFLFFLALYDKRPTVTSVVSETMPHLKRGAIRDFQTFLSNEGLWNEVQWNKSDSTYRFPSGAIIEFFSADQPGKVHGPARDRLFINEGQNLDWETARQLFIRTRETVWLDYNPTHAFWCHEHILPRDRVVYIHSTYKDNPFLTDKQRAEIESNRNDANWWRVYGEGKVGQLDGLVYQFEQSDALPSGDEASSLKECYGLDFGFTNDPTALVHILADTGRKVLYIDECIYRTRMLNSDIIAEMRAQDIGRAVEIYADCAEPKSIAEISRAGFNIVACDKDAPTKSDKIKFQLQWMQGWTIKVTKRSVNLIKELRNYTWAKDRDGNALNQPIDKWNHALDAMRYGVWTKFAERANAGHYSIRTSRHGIHN